jgi:hypothetical protein
MEGLKGCEGKIATNVCFYPFRGDQSSDDVQAINTGGQSPNGYSQK